MDCIYINLDSKTDRRYNIERNFELVKADGYTLRRFSALDTQHVKNRGIKGNLRDTEKACFLSHKAALKQSLETDSHSLILEDDVILGNSTFSSLEKVISDNSKIAWDILYLETCVPDIAVMLKLIKLRNSLIRSKSPPVMIDLTQFFYAGATAYVVNKNSKQKLFNAVDKLKVLDVPYDLLLRGMVMDQRLSAFVVFPFLSSFSRDAFASDIRLEYEQMTDLAWILFRKLVWAERNIQEDSYLYEKLKETICTPESDALSTIISAAVSEKFVSK